MDIFIARGEERKGPYSEDSIRQLLADGQLDGTELAWHEGLTEWIAVEEVGGEAETMAWVSDSNDPNNAKIEAEIRESLEKPEGELTKADLEKVTDLSLTGNVLTEVPKGLEKFTQLRALYLAENYLTDVKGLEKLTQVKFLSLHHNQLTDVSGLERLTQLSYLDLRDNQLTGVKGLEKLTQIRTLYLSGNQLTDVKGLEKLTELRSLDLQGSQLKDVKGLENLTQLTRLWLTGNPDLTKTQIDALQKALPNCEISSNPKK